MDLDLKSFDVNARRLINGPRNNLMAISPLKHAWAREIWQIMLANTWFPAEVSMATDVQGFKHLSQAEQTMYKSALAFLSNLDGIQFNNLVFNIGEHITSPEVSMCIARQAFEEANHVDSYATMIEAIYPDPMEIYMLFVNDPTLGAKNDAIMVQSGLLGNGFSTRNFAMAVVAHSVLEGIYFYSGFLCFYALARAGKMLASAKMIKYIQRDEITHLNLFCRMFKTLQSEHPEVFTLQFFADMRALIDQSVKMEVSWGQYITRGGVLGLSDEIIDHYIKYLADDRLAMLGLPPIYKIKNPVVWVDKISAINDTETNFFEDRVDTYSVGGTLKW
jgi:ribonucleoside-diphosphate reductase beta chain